MRPWKVLPRLDFHPSSNSVINYRPRTLGSKTSVLLAVACALVWLVKCGGAVLPTFSILFTNARILLSMSCKLVGKNEKSNKASCLPTSEESPEHKITTNLPYYLRGPVFKRGKGMLVTAQLPREDHLKTPYSCCQLYAVIKRSDRRVHECIAIGDAKSDMRQSAILSAFDGQRIRASSLIAPKGQRKKKEKKEKKKKKTATGRCPIGSVTALGDRSSAADG